MYKEEFHNVWLLARENGYHLIISSDGFYSVCDYNFKSLVKCTSLDGAKWYINNMKYLDLSLMS
jgi:hypothetical protein